MAFLDAVISGPEVDDDTFSAARHYFSDQTLVEVVTLQVVEIVELALCHSLTFSRDSITAWLVLRQSFMLTWRTPARKTDRKLLRSDAKIITFLFSVLTINPNIGPRDGFLIPLTYNQCMTSSNDL